MTPTPLNVANVVRQYVAPNIYDAFFQAAVRGLQGVRGFRVTSWYRSPAHNAAVGGSRLSQHQLGLALDFVIPIYDRERARAQLSRAGLTVFDEGDHLHAQAFRAGVLDPVFRALRIL